MKDTTVASAQGFCACQGIFVRGGVSHGPFFFEDDVLISPAQARAYDLETNAAEFPIIVVPQSTRDAVLTTPKMGSYAPGADPTPDIFKKYGRRKWKGQQLYFLDYVGVMLNEDHRGWLPEDLAKYRAAVKKGDNKRANHLLNHGQFTKRFGSWVGGHGGSEWHNDDVRRSWR